ncbi:embigin [Geothlypis trichas]
MPATFSGRCLVRLLLLLLLLCTSLSGENPTDPAMTTQDSNQTQVNSVTKMSVTGHESSDAATQELKPGNKLSTDLSEYVIVLPGVSEKNISVASPTQVDLTCKLDANSNLKNPEVTWKKGSETISHTSKTPNSWTIQVTISGSSDLGSYTCFLKAEKEISATFHLHVPPLEGREKPIITYIGDTGVMVCKTEYHALGWNWYMTNGTELVSIDKILPADKYEILRPSASASRLEIHRLTAADTGVYWCEAAFELGPSIVRFKMKVLSIAEPLKPFIAVVAEVAILVTTIGLYEVYSKRKTKGAEKEFDQIEQLKSTTNVEDNGSEKAT